MGEQAATHGWCSVCRRGPFTILATGVVKTHGPLGQRCEGSLEDPAAAQSRPTEPGWCPVCRRGPFAVVLPGVLRTHGPLGQRCGGSLAEPVGRLPGRLPRSLQVLALAADGLTDAQIGARLCVSPYTIKTHLKRAYAQLGARSRAHAVHLACHRGVLGCRHEQEAVS